MEMDTDSPSLMDFGPDASHDQRQPCHILCAFCSQTVSQENLESGATINQTHLKSVCDLLHLSWTSFEPFLNSAIRQNVKPPIDDVTLTLNLCFDCQSWVLYVIDLYEKLETARKKIIHILRDSALVFRSEEGTTQAQVNSIAHRMLKQCLTPCIIRVEKLPDEESCLEPVVEGGPTEELIVNDADHEMEDTEVKPELQGTSEPIEGGVENISEQAVAGSRTRCAGLGRQAKNRALDFLKNILQKNKIEDLNEKNTTIPEQVQKASSEETSTDSAEPLQKRRKISIRNIPEPNSCSRNEPNIKSGKRKLKSVYAKRPLKPAKQLRQERVRRLQEARCKKPDFFLKVKDQSDIKVKCEACDATFDYPRLLDLHKLEAHKTGPDGNLLTFDCYICGDHINQEAYRVVTDMDQQGFRYVTLESGQERVHENFTTLCEFHIQQHYLNAPKPRDRSSRNQSKKGHPFACELCPLTFKSRARLDLHKMHHLPDKSYTCIVCSAAFSTESPLHTHLAKVHSIDLQMMDRYSCRRCLQIFLSNDPDKSSGQLSSQDLISFQNFVKEHLPCLTRPCLTQRQLKCRFCPEKFTKPIKVYSHEVKVHTQDYKYYCDQCGRPEVTALTLYFHQRVHSDVEHQFQCDKCPATFRMKTYLTQHLKTHDAVRSFQCSLCEKSFFTKFLCRNHERTHTAERTFPCPTCGKMFLTKCTAKKHDLVVHKKMVKQRYRPRKKAPDVPAIEVPVDAVYKYSEELVNAVHVHEGELAEAVEVDEAELAEACREDVIENSAPMNESQAS